MLRKKISCVMFNIFTLNRLNMGCSESCSKSKFYNRHFSLNLDNLYIQNILKHFLNKNLARACCLQNYRELSFVTLCQVHSNSKEVSFLSWWKKYLNLKTTYQIKSNSFLWSKLFENVHFAKYLISVPATLKIRVRS